MAYDGKRNPVSRRERRGFAFGGYRLDTTTSALVHVLEGYLKIENLNSRLKKISVKTMIYWDIQN